MRRDLGSDKLLQKSLEAQEFVGSLWNQLQP